MDATTKSLTATFERPVEARLIVRTANGEEWEPSDPDLARFGLASRVDLCRRAETMLAEAIGLSPGESWPEAANAVRYMIACALMYDHSPWADENGRPWEGEDSGDKILDTIRQALGSGSGESAP